MSETTAQLRITCNQCECQPDAMTLIDFASAWIRVAPPSVDAFRLSGTPSATSSMEELRRLLAMQALRAMGRANIALRRAGHVRVDRYAAKRRKAPQTAGAEAY